MLSAVKDTLLAYEQDKLCENDAFTGKFSFESLDGGLNRTLVLVR